MEIKILDIDPITLSEKILALGAKKVFDQDRMITYFKNTSDVENSTTFKLTEEDKLKFSAQEVGADREETTVFVSRKEEFVKILALMGYFPVTKVTARRISFELGPIDFDLDLFPGIPAFMELDVPANSELTQVEIISKLGLENNRAVQMYTPEVFAEYGKDYFAEFKI